MKKLLMMICLLSNIAFAEREAGGGDKIRPYFIEQGKKVMSILETNKEEIEKIVLLKDLQETLYIKNIKLEKELYDNTDSLVDATGEKRRIKLDRYMWDLYRKNKEDVRWLVLHEMLRAANINDNEYVVLNKILKIFPSLKAVDSPLAFPVHNSHQKKNRYFCQATEHNSVVKKLNLFELPAVGVTFDVTLIIPSYTEDEEFLYRDETLTRVRDNELEGFILDEIGQETDILKVFFSRNGDRYIAYAIILNASDPEVVVSTSILHCIFQ